MRIRSPVSAAIAFATAGAIGGSGGSPKPVGRLGNYSWPGFAVTRDGQAIYAHWDRRESNIMMMEMEP